MSANLESKALRRIGWGLLFELIDIRIMAFDVLPDFIGYILLAAGLHAISKRHAGFRLAYWVAIAMSVLTLPHVLMQSNYTLTNLAQLPLGLHLYGQLLLALHVLMAYGLFIGLRETAARSGDNDLHTGIGVRMQLYMAVGLAQLIAYPFILNMREEITGLLLVTGVLAFIMELLLVWLPFRMAKKRPRTG